MANEAIRSVPVERTPSSSLGAIVFGVIVALAIQVMFMLIGSAIGLVSLNFERGELPGTGATIGGGIYLAVTFIISFFLGGFIASRLSGQVNRSSATIHGAGVWGLATLAFVLFVGSALSSLGGLVEKAGMGAGTAAGLSAALKEISELKPKLVTDMSVMKGKAVTTIETEKPLSTVAERTQKEAETKAKGVVQNPRVQAGVRGAAGEAREVAAGVTAGLFGLFLLMAIASILGSLAGRLPEAKRAVDRNAQRFGRGAA